MKSTKLQLSTQGGWGIVFRGPHAICGKEQRGGVSVCRVDHDGKEMAGEVLTRQSVRRLHEKLGDWIAHWDAKPAKKGKARK